MQVKVKAELSQGNNLLIYLYLKQDDGKLVRLPANDRFRKEVEDMINFKLEEVRRENENDLQGL